MMARRDLPELWQVTLGAWRVALEGDSKRLSPNTVTTYLYGATEWLLHCTNTAVDPLSATRTDVRAWIAAQRRSGASASLIATRLAAARRLSRWLVSEGDMPSNPFEGIGRIRVPEPETPVMSDDDVRKLLRAVSGDSFIDRRDNAILRLLFDTGTRRNECAMIKVGDLDLRNRVVVIRGKSKPGEGPHIRVVPFGEKCAMAIVRYLRMRQTHPQAQSEWLWLSVRTTITTPPTGQLIRTVATRRSKEAGVAFRPHLARHKWADTLYRENVSDRAVDRLAGWRDSLTGRRYGRALEQERAIKAARDLSLGDKL